jgi:hypothetical protein
MPPAIRKPGGQASDRVRGRGHARSADPMLRAASLRGRRCVVAPAKSKVCRRGIEPRTIGLRVRDSPFHAVRSRAVQSTSPAHMGLAATGYASLSMPVTCGPFAMCLQAAPGRSGTALTTHPVRAPLSGREVDVGRTDRRLWRGPAGGLASFCALHPGSGGGMWTRCRLTAQALLRAYLRRAGITSRAISADTLS